MLQIGKYKKEIGLIILLSIVYFAVRAIFLTKLPIFTDEAIYLRWAQIALRDSNWRFISLTDGKQPLFIWFVTVFEKLISDPLLAGRLVSVFSGYFTLLGLLLLSYELFKNKTVSLLTGLLYIVYPFAQVYDRMALMDGMVGTFAVWGLLFGIILVRKIRLDVAYTLGFIIGGAALTKSNGFFSAYLLPFTLILFDFKKKDWKHDLIKWGILALFAYAISQAMYSVLRLSPFFYIIAEKNNVFIYTFQQWAAHPFTYLIGNLTGLLAQFISYTFPIFLVLPVIGLFKKKFIKENLLLAAYFIVPFLAFALVARIIYPRYIYPMSLSLIPLAGLGFYSVLEFIKNKTKSDVAMWILALLILAYPAFNSIQIAADPVHANFAQADRDQYVSTWPSGWGVKEAVSFFRTQAQSKKIAIYTEGTFGLMPFSLELYLVQNPNVKIVGVWPIDSQLPTAISDSAKQEDTYVLFYQPCPACQNQFDPPTGWNAQKILSAPMGNLAVYKVLSK